jgi:hypothetical protein
VGLRKKATFDSMAAKPGLHALEQTAKRGINADSVEFVLDA